MKNFKNKFLEKKYSAKLFLRGVYLDFLRVLFSQYVVRNRKVFGLLVSVPILYYMIAFEIKEMNQIKNHRTRKKYLIGEKLLYDRGLSNFDEETYAHYTNYMKTRFPR